MAGKTTDALVSQEAQRRRAKKDLLFGKKPKEKTVALGISNEEGETEEMELLFRSLGQKQYDDLVAQFPPTDKQKREGMSYNIEAFAPALIAACCVDPELSLEEAQTLWKSDTWNRGELLVLFMAAIEVNTTGLDIPFTETA